MTVAHRPTPAATGGRPGRVRSVVTRLRRDPHLVFGAAALMLVPWIVVLALTQQERGIAPNIEPLRLVLVSIIVVAGLALVVHTAADRLTACMVGGAVTGFALCVVWFDLITRVGLPTTRLVVRLGAYSAMVGVCSALLALLWLYGPRSGGFAGPRALLFLSVALLALQATSILTNGALRLEVDNVGVAWVGLDICEFLGLATLAITLRKERRFVVFAGPATAALLFSDAAINVLTSDGVMSVLAALAMAVIEIGLGCLAIAVARQRARGSVVRAHGTATSRPAG